MPKQRITFSLSDEIVAALTRKAKPFDMTPGELLEHRILMSAMGIELPLNLAAAMDSVAVAPAHVPLQEQEFRLGEDTARPVLPPVPPQPTPDVEA